MGRVVYKLSPTIKNWITKRKTPAKVVTRQVKIARPRHPSNELEESNQRIGVQYNNQSNLPSLRNDDQPVNRVSRRSGVQGDINQNSLRTRRSRRGNQNTIISSEPRRVRSNPRNIENNNRKYRLN